MSTASNCIRIGGGSAFWGDTPEAAVQLVERGQVDALMLDYLAEVTMSILARARAKNASTGYASDFPEVVMRSIARQVAQRRIKVVTNAGGMNVAACREAVLKVAAELGVTLRVAIVTGDDLSGDVESLRAAGVQDLDTGAALPQTLSSVNAYLGAMPIAAALDAGADIVITGRCVDSALVLGVLIHRFGWKQDDYDQLAGGSLAGHILECGTQATGGIFTDWDGVQGWEDMGFPIAECHADGAFVVTKPEVTGGLVSRGTVAEQLVYEVGDPSAYILPDVVCDFSHVQIEEVGPHRVRVSGARGKPPTPTLKVCATYQDGFRSTAMYTMVGRAAAMKAQRSGEAILQRCRELFRKQELADFRRVDLKLLGVEHLYGANAEPALVHSREVTLRLDVHHDSQKALAIFGREIAPAGTAMAPGRCSLVGGRPTATPLVRLFSFLWPRDKVQPRVDIDGVRVTLSPPHPGQVLRVEPVEFPRMTSAASRDDLVTMPLLQLVWARSGDKGDSANIGIVARDPEYFPFLCEVLTTRRIAEYFGHLVRGEVKRYALPGICGINFLMTQALGGGGTASLRNDPLGKCYAQMLLDIQVQAPRAWASRARFAIGSEATL